MTEDALLFAAALANPAEHTPRLVLADWYDERDEPDLAAALRASPEMVAFLSDLTKWDKVPAHPLAVAENRAVRYPFPLVPASQLLTRHAHLFPVPPAVYTTWAEDAPAPTHTSSSFPVAPLHFLYRWQHQRQDDIRALRELAARASAREQPPDFTEPVDARAFEEQSCLLHELVVREREHAAQPAAVQHAERMKERGHPLAWLPLSLLSIECLLPTSAMRFSEETSSSGYNNRAGNELAATAVPLDAPHVIGTEELPPETPMFAAMRYWEIDSNGRFEGYVFHLDRELGESAIGRLWFTRLPARSVEGSILDARWFVNRMSAASTLALLFGAAQCGGAYTRFDFGAYGRLHAWQSFGALVGCAADASIEVVAREAERCEWFSFGGSAWFYHLQDVGVICVRADRRTVALLAATDTD